MTGHVFVIMGDARHLACDAFLQATDRRLRPGGRWLNALPGADACLDPAERAAFENEEVLAIPVRQYPSEAGSSSAPVPVLTAVPLEGLHRADQLDRPLSAYFAVAAGIVGEQRSQERGLVAVTLFGTWAGGGGGLRAAVATRLHSLCRHAAEQHGFDVAIVLKDRKAYDLLQVHRRGLDQEWALLTPALHQHAEKLAERASEGRLVPFMGSGVSVTAGAPSWDGLIKKLGAEVDLGAHQIAALSEMDVMDQAAYLRRAFAKRDASSESSFAAAIIRAVDVPRYGLAPALLAALTSEEAITLNYDTLFERAAADAKMPRAVIPGEPAATRQWLLKLHGSVDNESSIVLTRSDYLGFDSERGALSSLVKATLMTRELLFVGFGMKDAHFHEIVHDVRRALPDSTKHFGTVLTLDDNPVARDLWEGELQFIILEAAQVPIFLDAVLAFAATSHGYLLDDRYQQGATAEDAALTAAVRSLLNQMSPDARRSKAWPVLADALNDLGLQAEADPETT